MTQMTAAEATRSKMLDSAAAARREAASRQARAMVLCVSCKGPDGEHVSECELRRSRPFLVAIVFGDRGRIGIRCATLAGAKHSIGKWVGSSALHPTMGQADRAIVRYQPFRNPSTSDAVLGYGVPTGRLSGWTWTAAERATR